MNTLRRKENRREYNAVFEDSFPGKPQPLGMKVGGRDATTRGKFVPNINLSKWDDGCWLNINHRDKVTSKKETFDGSTIALSVNDHTHRFYLTKAKDIEYEIVLQKPEILEFDLDFPDGLEFLYQWPLKDYWYRESLNETREVMGCKTLQEYLKRNTRPENVEGSYAVRWGKAQGVGDGDFCHIFRPKLIDANGKERWADIFIEPIEKKLLIECDFEGLAFPVTVDPTIGTLVSDTAGWTNYSAATLDMVCWKATCGTDGTTHNGTAYVYCQQYLDNGAKVALGIYNNETGGGGTKAPEGASQFSNGDTGELAAPASVAYVSGAISFSAGLVSSTDYWLCLALNSQCYIQWKAGATDQTGYTTGWTYASPIGDPLPVTVLADLARYWRWRVDYTEREEITALCRKRFFPTETVSNNGWSPDSGSTTDAVKTNENYLYSATENALIYYRFEVPDIYGDTENVLGARLRFEGQRESANKRHFRPYLYMGAAEHYGTKANEVDRLTVLPDAAHQLYLEYQLDPTDDSTWVIGDFADIQAGLKICTNDGAGEDLENVEDADPGARINELILELILAPNATDAYMTHWIGFGGVTNNRLRVGVRTNQAAKVRIMYGTVEANVKSSEIGSLDGDTLVTDDPGSDNAVSANDFCVHIDITSLTYPETYYFDVYVDGVSMYEFESGSEAYSSWYALPSCATLPPPNIFIPKNFACIGDFHDAPLELRTFEAITGIAGKSICMTIRLGDTHSQHSDVLNMQAEDAEVTTRNAAMAGCREGWQSRVGFQLPATYYVEEIKKHYPDEGIYSDHDFVGDNATKSGHVPRYMRQDGAQPCWQKFVHDLDNGTQIDINDINAAFSNESTITVTNQGETTNTRINMNVDGYTVQVIGTTNNKFVIGITVQDQGAASIIKCGSGTLADEATVGGTYAAGAVVGVKLEIYQHRTWNTLKVFKEYNPSYDYCLPVDLTGQATGGSATTLVCTNTEYRQFTYATLADGTPTARTYTNGYWADGDMVDWNAGADTGELVYHNTTDKIMVIKCDDNTSPLDGSDTIIELASNDWNVTTLSNVYTFPRESIYGIYPGMMVYHGSADDDFATGPSWSTIRYGGNDGNTLTFNTALRIGDEAFAADDYFRVKRELLSRSFWIGKTQFWIIDIRNKSDRQQIIAEGMAGCDWLDGTREWTDAKVAANTDDATAGYLQDTSALGSVVEGDVVTNTDVWRFTASATSGTFDVNDACTWNATADGGVILDVTTDAHGNAQFCIRQTSGSQEPEAGDTITETGGAGATCTVWGDIRNEFQVVKIGGTHTADAVQLEDTYGSGSQTINLFSASGQPYEARESGGSDHGSRLANEKAGHVQREWLVTEMNASVAAWKFIICETPTYGVLESSPGNQFQLLPTMDPLDCLRQYLFS